MTGNECRTITVHHRLGDAEDPLVVAIADLAATVNADATVGPCSDCDTEPVSLRDLIRAARAAGSMPRRDRPAEYADRRYWRALDGRGVTTVFVNHNPDQGWRLGLVNDIGESVVLYDPSLDRIADAARLCGWPLFDLGAAT